MKKRIELLLLIIAVGSITLLIFLLNGDSRLDIIKGVGLVLAFNFFMYKLLTGWLFINLNIEVEPTRKNVDHTYDHIALKIKLKKGKTDSLWLNDIQIRILEIEKTTNASIQNQLEIIKPIGIKKFVDIDLNSGACIWNSPETTYYVISAEEEVTFSAYTKVKKTWSLRQRCSF